MTKPLLLLLYCRLRCLSRSAAGAGRARQHAQQRGRRGR
jgi:hypothetical protein